MYCQGAFAARDVYRKQWSHLNSSELVHQGTKILVDFGWVKEEPIEQKGKLIRKSRETIALVADTIDRVQRSFKESVVLDNLRKDGKVEIHFMREGLVLNLRSNSSDILRWDMGVMFARFYVLQLSDNIKRSKEQAAKRGVWMGLAPTGYMHVTNEKGEKTIVPDPDRAPFIRKLFEMYATGNYSLQTLKTAATEMGLRTKKGELLAVSQINKILKKPFYCGVMETKYGIMEHCYEPLITQALF